MEFKADIIIAGFPYGDLTSWQAGAANPIEAFFDNIVDHLQPNKSILAIIHNKKQKVVSTF